MTKHSWLWSLFGLLAVSGVSYGVFFATRAPELPEGFLYGNGHIEGIEIRIASEVAGRVLEQTLTEGERVTRGQTVVVIDAQTSREQLSAVEGELSALRDSKVALESQITLWAHHVETARRQLTRVRDLVKTNLASERDVDDAENGVAEAEGQLENLQAQTQALDGQIESAEARVRLAETRLQKTEVKAPADGRVLVRAVETGEVVQIGQPLGLIVDLSRLELKVYLPEREIGRIRLGSAARLRVDAFPERFFNARVARVDDYAQFTPRDIHMPEERTRMVYGVTLALENPEERLKPGMPADAWIRWDDAQPWPDDLPVPAR